jgi:hypothetical protein
MGMGKPDRDEDPWTFECEYKSDLPWRLRNSAIPASLRRWRYSASSSRGASTPQAPGPADLALLSATYPGHRKGTRITCASQESNMMPSSTSGVQRT